MTFGAIVLFVISLTFFRIGIGALNDSANHKEYGVESVSLHRKFSWSFIVIGVMAAVSAGLLLAS